MKYQLDRLTVDIGITPVENMFFNTYLLVAPGDAVRLYLYAFQKAYHGEECTHEEVAEDLSLSLEEVHIFWDYWANMGIVQKTYDENKDYTITFLSLRQLYLNNQAYISSTDKKDVSYQSNPEEVHREVETPAVEKMFREIEAILGTSLLPHEVTRILEDMNEYRSSPELVATAFAYSAEELGKRDFHYALGVLRKWYMAQIYTLEDWKNYLEKEEKKVRKKNTAQKMMNDQSSFKAEMDALIQRKLRESRKG